MIILQKIALVAEGGWKDKISKVEVRIKWKGKYLIENGVWSN